jgi:two-component system OmpR family sensor kinase
MFPFLRRPRSIVVPMVLLVVGAALIATVVQFAITFTGPPLFAPPVPTEEVARALRTGAVPRGIASRMEVSSRLSETPINGAPHPERDAGIARLLGVPASEIHGIYQLVPRPGGPRRGAGGPPEPGFVPPFIRGDFEIEWRSGNGVRVARSLPGPWFTAWHRVTLLSVLGVLIVLTFLAWWIARGIARPIGNLATAANAARLGTRTPIPQDGPREVRALAEALEAMQGRILEAAEGRTAMLAAIVHDLGTPLSRIAFHIEQLPDAERDRAAADLGEMRQMLGEVLRFVRDSRSGAASERIDLASLLESLTDDMAAGGMDVVMNPGAGAVIAGDSQALRRLFVNLIENAVRYGQKATIGW